MDRTPSSSFPTPASDADGADVAATDPGVTANPAGIDSGQLLFTPAQAAVVLQVRESWLRRRAAQRRVACSFLGKHLRFSRADLEAIVTDARRPSTAPRPRIPRVRSRRP